MASTVLSQGCMYSCWFVFQRLFYVDNKDNFIFVLKYRPYKIHIYSSDYSYFVCDLTPPQNIFEEQIYHIRVEYMIETFLQFFEYTFVTPLLYNNEKEIAHYLIAEDWMIWYAFFSSPYNLTPIQENEDNDDVYMPLHNIAVLQ
jgi:hypothetical protein